MAEQSSLPGPGVSDPWAPLKKGMFAIDPSRVTESPAWVIDREGLESNLKTLKAVADGAGCKILIALKGFATWCTFDLVQKYLSGATSSAVHEAMLAREKIGKEVHAYAPAYSEGDMASLVTLCDHLVFNSLGQWQRFRDMVRAAPRPVSCGLRVNPEHREVAVELYDPCAPRSRLGTTRAQLDDRLSALTALHPSWDQAQVWTELLGGQDCQDGLEGLHFHTLCELGSDALERTLAVVEAKFGDLLSRVKWVNFGGGHHITKPGYDVERLVRVIRGFRQRYPHVTVYLEPGEAVAIRTGVLVTTVLDIIDNQGPIAILDTSVTAHMPDVLEMPYRPDVVGAGLPGEKAFTHRLGGMTCLAGDVIGDYSFDQPLQVGQKLVFLDMSHYTMVKTSNFNGVRLPSVVVRHADDRYEVVKSFGYEIYRDRLS